MVALFPKLDQEKTKYSLIYFASVIFTFLKILLLAPKLGPVAFGKFSVLIVIMGLLQYLNSLGIFDSVIIDLNKNSPKKFKMMKRDTGLFAVASLSVITSMITMPLFAAFFLNLGTVTDFITLFIYCFLSSIAVFVIVELQAKQRYVSFATFSLLKNIFPTFSLLLLPIDWTLIDFILVEIFTIGICLTHFGLKLGIPKRKNININLIKDMMITGWFFNLTAATNNLVNNIDKIFLGVLVTKEMLGVYFFGYQLVSCGLVLQTFVLNYITPNVVSEALAGSNRKQIFDLLLFKIKVGILLNSLIFFGLSGVLYFYISSYATQYIKVVPLLPFFAFWGLIRSVGYFESAYRACALGDFYFRLNVLFFSSCFVLYPLVYIYDLGMQGVLLANIFSAAGFLIATVCFFPKRQFKK